MIYRQWLLQKGHKKNCLELDDCIKVDNTLSSSTLLIVAAY